MSKKQRIKITGENSISIGNIHLSSDTLSMEDLINLTAAIISDEKFREYLNVVKLNKTKGLGDSYYG